MERFTNQMRVRVVDPDEEHAELKDRVGLVVRLRRADDAAWVTMIDPLPPSLAVFPEGDDRHDDIMLWPDECEQLVSA